MSLIRTFIAIEVSLDVRARAASLAERLRVSGAQATWTKIENMHLTLQFLGDTNDTRIPDVCRAIAQAVRGFAPFDITFGHAGAFPDTEKPRTVWLGVDGGEEQLVSLHTAIENTLLKLGFPAERRRYKPHLTIARVRDQGAQVAELGRLVAANVCFDASTTTVDEVLIMASFLERGGPTYQVLGRAPLEG